MTGKKTSAGNTSAGDLGEKKLQNILHSMVANIESSKSQLFDVYEAARREVETSKANLEEIRRQTQDVIEEVDALTQEEQKEKQKLVHVSAYYSEEQIQAAYEAVKDVQALPCLIPIQVHQPVAN